MSKRFLLLFVLALALVGCSSGSNSPLTPQGSSSTDTMNNIPIIGMSMHEDGSFNALGMLGAYELIINPDNGSAELFAKRTPAIGEDYIVSGISFFTIAPCSDCLKIIGIDITPDGNAVLIFEINHPFKPGITSEPPSASNRNDLDVFDLAMVIAPTGATATTYSLTGVDAYPDSCVGADGYTTELANVISDTSALPFFLAVDDSEGTSSTFNKFGMGEDTTFEVGFSLSTGTLSFDMYLTMGYGFSAKKPNRLTPKYYNPEFNRKAAWKVDVTPPGGTAPAMGNTWDDNDTATTYDVTVAVYDWQVGATVYTGDPLLFGDADADNVFASSEVSSVSVEIPGMNSTLQSATTADSGAGTPIDPLIYTLAIANENQLAPGEYLGLVKVADERATLAPADGRDFLIDTPDGGELINYEMPEYATYQTFTATVVLGATACFVVDDIVKYYDGIGPDGTADNPVPTDWDIDFDATCSMGATSYDWDLDGDGTYEGTGGPLYSGGFPAGTAPGTYYPVLRLNGDDSLTFTSPDPIVVVTGVYVHRAASAGGDGSLGAPYNTIVTGVAGATTPATSIIMIRGDTDAGVQQVYNERIDLVAAHTGITLQGYSNDPVNSEPPAWRLWNATSRTYNLQYYGECIYVVGADDVKIDGFEFEAISVSDYPGSWWYMLVRVIHLVESDNSHISHILIHDTTRSGTTGWKHGYAILIVNSENVVVENYLFHDSDVHADYGTTCGIYANVADNILITHATIDNFYLPGYHGYAYGGLISNSVDPVVKNSIVSNITGYTATGTAGLQGNNGNTNPLVDYCNVYNIAFGRRFVNDLTEGSNCINVGTGSNPLYTLGHHLGTGSPCIGTGEDGVDIGCYGGPGGDWNFED
jgi:hypothetical protein